MTTFFEMGGYARFVWPAYGLVSVVALGLLVMSLRGLRCRQKELAALQERLPGRRGRVWE
ncbi:heme exporter protein CcmD [Telmatospirillum sp.]|uniref:heme exporter protein CcmD n=1 Tax=Telmatospirillum sp. TaxID=2079197 RepID=UPI0038638207